MTLPLSKKFNCKKCGVKTANPSFCSRSCSNSYNNSITPKRKRQAWHCPICDKTNRRSRADNFEGCVSCWRSFEEKRLGSMTLQEAINSTGRHKDKYNTVRHHGRKLSNLYDCCQICGYQTILQVCHIQPISSFSLSTPLSIINHPDNIAILCPNHHLELDRGIIAPNKIPARK